MERFWLLAFAIAAVVATMFLFQTAQVAKYFVQHYAVQVELDPQARALEIEARVQLKMNHPGQRGALYLFRFGDALELLEARFEGAQMIERSETEDKWHVFKFVGHAETPLAVLRYRIKSTPDIEGIAFHLGVEEGYVLSEATWIPTLAKQIASYPPTPYRLTVQLPEPFIAVSAGTLVEESHVNGRASFTWEVPVAIGSPFFAYGAYSVLREQDGEIYILPSLGEEGVQGGRKLLAAMREILSYYKELFGSPPELPTKIVAVTRRGGWGAPFSPLLNETWFTKAAEDLDLSIYKFLAHELAHIWWGNLVRPADLTGSGWLTEGMAEYAVALSLGHRYGAEIEQRAFQDLRAAYIDMADKDVPLVKQAPYDPVYRDSSYSKGAWIHRMLEGLLGRERYLSALKAFLQTHRGRAISPKDYQRALEQAYGKSLGWFFQQWIHRVTLPVYRVEKQPGAVRIINEGTGEMPLMVRLEYEDGSREDVRVRVPAKGAVRLTVRTSVARVILDPEGYVLHLQEEPIDEAVRAELLWLAGLLEKAIQTGDFTQVEATLVIDATTSQILSTLKGLGAIESFKTEMQTIRYHPQKQSYEVHLKGTMEYKGQRVEGLKVLWEFKRTKEGWSLVKAKIKS